MASSETPLPAKPEGIPRPPKPEKKLVKILMIHGYTQSGPLFRAKTRALEKLVQKALNPNVTTLTCYYPTAPIRLSPQDIPGYSPASAGEEDEVPDAWAWFRRDSAKDIAEATYIHFDRGMLAIAAAIREAGGVDGVVGFSQGGAMAAIVAAVLDNPQRKLPENVEWADELRKANGDKPLRFAVVYSGFYSPIKSLAWCYEEQIQTPTLHYIGSLDTIVEENRSRSLVDRCVDPVVMVHPGGHHVPVSKEWAMPLAGFIRQNTEQ